MTKKNLCYDRFFEALLRNPFLLESGSFVDCGAHTGAVMSIVSAVRPSWSIYAFEPLDIFASRLVKEFHSATVYKRALSDFDGTSNFLYVPDRPKRSGLAKTALHAGYDTVRLEKTPVSRLDSFDEIRDIRLIKIDTEGSELDVLVGGAGLIGRDRPIIVFEASPLTRGRQDRNPADLYAWFLSKGYLIANLAPSGASVLKLVDFEEAVFSMREWNFLAVPDEHFGQWNATTDLM